MDIKACSTCTHAMPGAPDGNLYCRRYPPQLVATVKKGDYMAMFPAMQPSGLCGEYQVKITASMVN